MGKTLDEPQTHSKNVRGVGKSLLRNENAIMLMVLLALIGVLGAVTKGKTFRIGNISNIWLQSSSRGLATIGQAFVLLGGGIDLSVGGIALASAILGSSLMTGQTGFPATAIATMLLFGAGVGLANGVLVSRVPMPSLIVTLGMWEITKGVGYLICGGRVIRHLPESLNPLGGGYVAGMPVPVIILLVVGAVAYFVLYHTTFGRSVYAAGGSPVSAWLSGINVKNVQLVVFTISGFLAALAGLIIMARTMSGGMGTVVGLELDSIAAVAIGGISLMGGKGTLVGALIGLMILGVINNGMNVFVLDPAYRRFVKGGIIIAAVGVDYWRRRG